MGYSCSRSISIDYTKCGSSDSANFPVLFSGVYPYLATVPYGGKVQNSSGFDIGFSLDQAGNSLLPWEIEYYDQTTGTIVAWVQVPNLTNSSNTLLYDQYGNAAITTFQGGATGAVWDGNFMGVYHLGSSLTADSTANGNNGTLSTPPPTQGSGQIDGGGVFVAASSEYISIGTGLNPGPGLTYSAWVKASSFPNAYNSVIAMYGTSEALFLVNSSGKLAIYIQGTSALAYDGTGINTLVPGTWYYLTLTYDTVNGLIGYVNAAVDGTAAALGAFNSIPSPAYIGTNYYSGIPNRLWDGLLDEVRVSNIARSADWITAEYNNQSSPSTFYTLGPEVTLVTVPVPFVQTVTAYIRR